MLMTAPVVACRRLAAVARRSPCRASMPAAMPSSQPTLESGYSDAPNGTSKASTAKLIVTMASVVIRRARSVISFRE